MFKTPIIGFICMALSLLIQCKSATTLVNEQQQAEKTGAQIEMRKPNFADTEVTFYKWFGGSQGTGSGINMTFLWNALPDNLVMKEAYFRDLRAPIKLNQKGYKAFFKHGQKTSQDTVMHSDPLQEAGNTPPVQESRFPVKLTDQEVGIIYEEDGQLVYTIVSNLIEQPQIPFPSVLPHSHVEDNH